MTWPIGHLVSAFPARKRIGTLTLTTYEIGERSAINPGTSSGVPPRRARSQDWGPGGGVRWRRRGSSPPRADPPPPRPPVSPEWCAPPLRAEPDRAAVVDEDYL